MSSAPSIGIAANALTLKHLIIQNRTEAEKAAAELADRRKHVDEMIAAIEKQYEDDNFTLLLQNKEATEAAASYDQQLREMTIQYFQETGDKHMDADCSVRVSTKYQYETSEAVKWAETNAPVMIVKSVDKKSFESLPNVADLDFVEKVETATAVIAKTFTEV